MGVTFTVYTAEGNIDRAWPFDIIPRTIASGNGTGQAVPSTLAVIGDRVGGIVSEYKTPVIAVSAAVVVTVIGVAAWKVFR